MSKTATAKKPDSEFARAVDHLREVLNARGIDIKDRIVDAKKPMEFFVGHSHIDGAVVGDNDRCVLARAVRDYYRHKKVNIWIAHTFTMILDWEKEKVFRYVTSSALWKALKTFDKTGTWPLAPNKYTLRPPTGTNKLVKNMTKEERAKAEVKHQKWRISNAAKKAAGLPTGKRSFSNGRDLTRHISVLPADRRKPRTSAV